LTSLRAKILTSFGLSKIALLVFAAILIADLLYLKNRILEGETVNALYVACQEIRRDEKNLFLYNSPSDYRQVIDQLDIIEAAFTDSRPILTEIATPEELTEVDYLLLNYREQLEQYPAIEATDLDARQDTIRKSGQDLLAWARELGKRERASLAHTARVAAWTLLGILLTVILLGMISALFIVRQVVKPLGDLESQLDDVADGNILTLTLPSQDKEIQSVVHHFNDMLERLRGQQIRLRKHEKAAALGVLASGVAHELNNPLSNISTSVQLLMESGTSTDENLRNQWMSHIDDETERAKRIVKRLLDSVRHPQLHLRAHNLPDLLKTSIELVLRQLPDTIHVHVMKIPACKLYLDRDRMQQVFINLIKNAADAGAQNIWIDAVESTWDKTRTANLDHVAGDTDQVSQSPAVIRIQITDDGPGIADEHLDKIFNPFFTTKSAHDGTGLGLYLVGEIISQHNACIAAENRDEGGTRFNIWLPFSNAQEAA
jgi:signal transduction histidine kinase